jgi:hypothetical protein
LAGCGLGLAVCGPVLLTNKKIDIL